MKEITKLLNDTRATLDDLCTNDIALMRFLNASDTDDEQLDDYLIDVRTKLEDTILLIDFIKCNFLEEEY